jgi:hypothetical protein
MKPNNLVYRGYVIGLGNSEILDHTIYHGLRFRDDLGTVHHVNRVVVAPSVNIVLRNAFSSGEEVEMWFCGNGERKVLYGIKTYGDQAYEVAPVKGATSSNAMMFFLLGLLTAFFLIGFLFMIYAFFLWGQGAKFSPYERWEFDRSPNLANGGFRSGDLEVMHASVPAKVTDAQEAADRARKVDDLKAWIAKSQAGAK